MPHVLDAFGGRNRPRITSLAVVALGLGLLALVAPVSRAEFPAARVGWLLTIAAGLELLHAMRQSNADARRRATIGGVISITIAIFLINAPFVGARTLRLLVAGWFAVDAVRYAIETFRRTDGTERALAGLAALGNTVLALLLLFARGSAETWVVAIAGAGRIVGIAWNIATAPVYTTADAEDTVVRELGLTGQPAAVALANEVEAAERGRAPADRGWTIAFILTLFAIHVGRMRADLTMLGLLAPLIAVLGDMALAVMIALLVINPLHLMWRRPTRWIERRVWQRYLRQIETAGTGWTMRVADAWLRWRMRLAIRMRAGRYSLPASLSHALQTGLPVAAIVAATVPVWGMNWYFDTENWAAGVWNSWAESRTDTWRERMVRAVLSGEGARAASLPFAVEPEGLAGGDFSFVVIGDPGEGDASQHVLRDQLLTVAASADVRFVVVSSDVVYPSGAMADYEAKFWLPFKGITRPVYAIPGNHDWYDALEAFAATFLQPEAARASIRARMEADLRVTSTTEARIERLIDEAGRLRVAYGVPTGFQRAPFFEIQTDRFALDRDRHRHPAVDRSGAGRMARGGAPAIGRQADDGDRRPSLLRGWPRRNLGRRSIRPPETAPAPSRCDDPDGGRQARSRVPTPSRPASPPTRCTTSSMAAVAHFSAWARRSPGRRRRRLSTGPTTRPATRWRTRSTQEPPGGSGRPGGGPRISMRGRSAPGGSPPRSTTTWPRFFRASSRSRWNHPRIAFESSRTGCMGA